jgi:hypothetical protein
MTGRLGGILDKVLSTGVQQQAASAGIGAALGAVLGPAAATLTGDDKTDKNTMTRDMLAGALGGAVGGLMGPAAGTLGGAASGLIAGLFDKKAPAEKLVYASDSGQDLRLPVMGGTKFPTHDSVNSASRRLNQSSAEVGPQPQPTYSMTGKMKKVKIAASGDIMDPMMDDPLVQYLKKTAKDEAKEQPPLTGLVEGSELKDNLSDMPRGTEEFEQASQSPDPTKRMIPETPCTLMRELFTNAQTMRKKLYEKDHPFEGFDQGVVDRILGL